MLYIIMEHITYRGVHTGIIIIYIFTLFIYLLLYKMQLPCDGNDGEGN